MKTVLKWKHQFLEEKTFFLGAYSTYSMFLVKLSLPLTFDLSDDTYCKGLLYTYYFRNNTVYLCTGHMDNFSESLFSTFFVGLKNGPFKENNF